MNIRVYNTCKNRTIRISFYLGNGQMTLYEFTCKKYNIFVFWLVKSRNLVQWAKRLKRG